MKNGELKIEKGIPLPINIRSGPKGTIAEPMRSMKKGDSVFLLVSRSTASQYAMRYLGKGNWASAKEKNGIRIWRIK